MNYDVCSVNKNASIWDFIELQQIYFVLYHNPNTSIIFNHKVNVLKSYIQISSSLSIWPSNLVRPTWAECKWSTLKITMMYMTCQELKWSLDQVMSRDQTWTSSFQCGEECLSGGEGGDYWFLMGGAGTRWWRVGFRPTRWYRQPITYDASFKLLSSEVCSWKYTLESCVCDVGWS